MICSVASCQQEEERGYDRKRTDLLLEVFTNLVVHLELLLDLLELFGVNFAVLNDIVRGKLRGVEEVEERLCWVSLLHKSGAVGG